MHYFVKNDAHNSLTVEYNYWFFFEGKSMQLNQPKTQTHWLSFSLLSSLLCCSVFMSLDIKLPSNWKNDIVSSIRSIQLPQNKSSKSHAQEADEIPMGISSVEWYSIQQQIYAGKYRAYPNALGGYNSSNPAHGWQIRYDANGTTHLSPRNLTDSEYKISMKLAAIGYDNLQALGSPQQISKKDFTVSYQWHNYLKEWWINKPDKLEQWFSISQRPFDDNYHSTVNTRPNPLVLLLQLETDLSIHQFGNSLHFTNANGNSITYNKLKVWDADGHRLTAQMQLIKQQLKLIIDDSTAIYPITIDPSFQQQAYIKASNTETDDRLGVSVAISGNTLVVGADREASNATGLNGDQSNNGASFSGAVYVFTRSGSIWSQQAYLKASNTEMFDQFGRSVAIAGDTLVVGAVGEDSSATGVNGDQSDNTGAGAGAVYVFTRSGNTWSQQAYLKASNTDIAGLGLGDNFGSSVAISGDTVIVGAESESSNTPGVDGDQSNNSTESAGAVYVFIRSGNIWSQQAYIKASNPGRNFYFGGSVAIAGDTLVVGSVGDSSDATGVDGDQSPGFQFFSGAAYVFTRSGSIWSQQAYLKASNTNMGAQFGGAVAITGDTLVVGSAGESSNSSGVDGDQFNALSPGSGAAYVFTRTGNNWSQHSYFKASNPWPGNRFGSAVAITENTVVVGSPGETSKATGVDGDQADKSLFLAGAAYVFIRNNNTWSQQSYLKASNTASISQFGKSVAIDDDTIVVGSDREDSSAKEVNGDQDNMAAVDAGAAYVFFRSAGAIENQSIPTLSEWAIILLVVLLALLVIVHSYWKIPRI